MQSISESLVSFRKSSSDFANLRDLACKIWADQPNDIWDTSISVSQKDYWKITMERIASRSDYLKQCHYRMFSLKSSVITGFSGHS